jgi:4-amino-4-deoxy-L-arabinose transferase-like glycosyltransferase
LSPERSGLPARVRVTSSRRTAVTAVHAQSRLIARDLDEQTELGDVYLEGLMRAQLRLALTVLALMVAALGGFPLLLTLVPSTRTMTLAGVPLPWLVLGVLVYPATWLLARGYVRQAERIEADFADIVEPGRDG